MEQYTGAPRRVELVIDLTCVHSYLGFTRFERAAQRFRDGGGQLDVVLRPFQVSPDAPGTAVPLSEVHRRDFGDQAERLVERMTGIGAEAGLQLNFGRALHVNTFEAHRLLAAAGDQGLAEPMAERLFRAYLTDGLDIGDRATLARLAAEVGVRPPVDGADGVQRLRAELERTRARGVHSVPQVLFDDGPALSGARAEEEYLEALTRLPV